jgi:hypothetical protein
MELNIEEYDPELPGFVYAAAMNDCEVNHEAANDTAYEGNRLQFQRQTVPARILWTCVPDKCIILHALSIVFCFAASSYSRSLPAGLQKILGEHTEEHARDKSMNVSKKHIARNRRSSSSVRSHR